MTPKEGLEAIKKLLFNDAIPPAPVAPVALATEYKLEDGTMVSIDKLEAGGIVTIAGAPAPDGQLKLEDGTALTIVSGMISIVTPVTPVEAPVDLSKQFAADFAAFKVEFASHKEAFTKVQADFAAANETIGKQDLAIKGLLEVVTTLAKTDVANPVEAPVDFEKLTPIQKFRLTKI
jgi:hypothetical protein